MVERLEGLREVLKVAEAPTLQLHRDTKVGGGCDGEKKGEEIGRCWVRVGGEWWMVVIDSGWL